MRPLLSSYTNSSPSGDGPNDQQRFLPRHDRLRQRRIDGLMRKVLLAREEPQKRPPLLRDVVADRSAQHRITRFNRVDYGPLGDRPRDFNLHLPGHLRQSPPVLRKPNPHQGSVCTSTDSTAGRSRTKGSHVSPASAEPYTCPPAAPKYTPP